MTRDAGLGQRLHQVARLAHVTLLVAHVDVVGVGRERARQVREGHLARLPWLGERRGTAVEQRERIGRPVARASADLRRVWPSSESGSRERIGRVDLAHARARLARRRVPAGAGAWRALAWIDFRYSRSTAACRARSIRRCRVGDARVNTSPHTGISRVPCASSRKRPSMNWAISPPGSARRAAPRCASDPPAACAASRPTGPSPRPVTPWQLAQ